MRVMGGRGRARWSEPEHPLLGTARPQTHDPGKGQLATGCRRRDVSLQGPQNAERGLSYPCIPHLDQLGAGHGQQVGHAGEFGEELLGELLEAGTAQPLQEQPHAGPQLHPLRPVEAAERGACGGRASISTCRGTVPQPLAGAQPLPQG